MDRALGDIEYFYWLLDQTCRTNFVIVAEVCGGANDAILREALAVLQLHHPPLRSRIVVEDSGEVWFRAAASRPIPLRVVDSPGDEAAVIREVESEQGARFDTAHGPLLRCALLRHGADRATLLATFHHAIADAISATGLVGELLRTAGAIESGHGPGDTGQAPCVSFAERIRARSRGFRAWWTQAKLAIAMVFGFLLRGRPRRERTDSTCAPADRRDRFLSMAFSEEETARVVAGARAHGTTVHGALCAAQLLALHAELPDSESRRRVYGLNSLVSARDLVSPPVSAAVTSPHVSITATFHPVRSEALFWKVAKEVRSAVARQVAAGVPLVVLPRLARRIRRKRLHLRSGGAAAFFRRLERLMPKVSLVSNIGRVVEAEPHASAFRTRRLHFFFAIASSGRFGSSATTYRNQLQWNFTYAYPTFEPETARRLADRAQRLLLDACVPGDRA